MNSRHNQTPDSLPGPGHHTDSPEEELDIRELARMLNRRKGAIFGIFFLVVVITGLWLYQATPLYTATAQLTLDIRKSRVVDVEEVLSGISTDASTIGTELDIIRSTALLERVVDKLNLENSPDFNPALHDNPDKNLLRDLRQWVAGLWGPEETPEAVSPEEERRQLRQRIVGRIKENLEVEHRRQSHTISLAFTAEDPRQAARIANSIADAYLTDQLEAKFDATRRANEWLADRLENLRNEVRDAEQAVKNIREESDIVIAGGSTILDQQLSDVNSQLIQARVKQSRAESRLERAREIKDRPGGIESLGEVMDSSTIQNLRSQESSLRRKRAELSQRYGPRHPEMLQIEAEMSDLRNKLEEETSRIIESLENEVEVAQAEVRSLERSMAELRTDAGRAMEAGLELRELERQAESSRSLYENFLQRFQETREQDALQRPDARIIAQAQTPASPSFPNKKRTLALGMAAGLIFGVMGAFLLEKLDRGFRTGDQVEQLTGHALLGSVPLLERKYGNPVSYVVAKPFSAFSESLRAIRTAIHLSNVDSPPKTVMVTSSLPREGKTTFSMSMARVAALSGLKTILVDADLRRPSVAKTFGHLNPVSRLEDILQNEATLADARVRDPESGMDLLMAHGRASTIRELLGSARMKSLLDELKSQYDLVVIDTPPFMGVSDAWALARSVDSLVFLVCWAETPRETVQSAIRQMENLDIHVSGAVLSMVNIREQARYGYGGYGYYYGQYKKYYEE